MSLHHYADVVFVSIESFEINYGLYHYSFSLNRNEELISYVSTFSLEFLKLNSIYLVSRLDINFMIQLTANYKRKRN